MLMLSVKQTISPCSCLSLGCMWLFHMQTQCQLIMSVHVSGCMWLFYVGTLCQAYNFTMSVHVLRLYVTLPWLCLVSSLQFHNVCAYPQIVCDSSMCMLNVKLTSSQRLCVLSECMWLFHVHTQCQAYNGTMSVYVLRMYVTVSYSMSSLQFHNFCGCPQIVCDFSMHVLSVDLILSQCLCSVYVTIPCAYSMSSWLFHNVCTCYQGVCDCSICMLNVKLTISLCPQRHPRVCDCSLCMLNVKLTISLCLCMSTECMWPFHVHAQCWANNCTMSVHVLSMYVTFPCAYMVSSW
jgi:hypothetical protein